MWQYITTNTKVPLEVSIILLLSIILKVMFCLVLKIFEGKYERKKIERKSRRK